jgi:MYXO-CTERM domain-containing protein
MTGSVTFTFETYAPQGKGNIDGGFDDSWALGTVAITPTTAGNATATLSTAIPPGFDGNADVVAMYDGDNTYLGSRSAKTRIVVGGLTLAVAPTTATTYPGGTVQFTASGGVTPYKFYVSTDSTAGSSSATGNFVGAKVDNTGLLTAGPKAGAIALEVLDAAGATAWMTVTVTGNAPEAGAPEGGSGSDASTGGDASGSADGSTGKDGAAEGGHVVEAGLGPTDGGTGPKNGDQPDGGSGGSSKSGCGCAVVGSDRSEPATAAGLLFVGLVFARRRRRS